MISTQRNFLFVHIPKTAGNSIQNILLPHADDQLLIVDDRNGLDRFGLAHPVYDLRKHSPLRDYQAQLPPDLFAHLLKFTCVRNPWERLISMYFSPHRGPVAWDRTRFVTLVNKLTPAAHFLALPGDPPGRSPFQNADVILRQERLGDDFRALCERLQIRHEPLPVRNKSAHQHYATYYDPELIALVRARFRDDIEFFGYEFEPTPRPVSFLSRWFKRS